MTYEKEITNEQGAITRLKAQLKQIKIPARTINWQHNNIGAPRNITKRVLVARKQRKKVNSRVTVSRKRIMSLRESILGRDALLSVE